MNKKTFLLNNYYMLSSAIKQSGTFEADENMWQIEENLTGEQYDIIERFFDWVHTTKNDFGSGNYEERVNEYFESLKAEKLSSKKDESFLVQIASGAPGKHCDLYPPHSVHLVKNSPKGLQLVNAKNRWIDPNFDTVLLAGTEPLNTCPKCKTDYSMDVNFISNNQKGDDEPTCLRCYEKNNIRGDRYAYREAIRQELIKELQLIGL